MKNYIIPVLMLFGCLNLQCDFNILDALDIGSGEEKILIFKNNQTEFELSVELIKNHIFLEHVYSWETQTATTEIISTKYGTGSIYVSDDLGANFRLVYESYFKNWEGCLTTSSGRHILWDNNDANLWIFDKEWRYVKHIKTGDYPWHGNASIAEINNTIIYAEYARLAKELFVWRSDDDGNSWQKVFSQNAYLSIDADVKHFHTVQPDPFFPGHWYLSSGDRPDECKIWKSSDNGLTWLEVTDPSPEGTNLQSIHRYTAIHFDDSYLYWGTDDIMDGAAKFVRAARTEPLQVEVLGDLGNLTRSLVWTPHGLVFISEQKMIRDGKLLDMTIHISPDKMVVQELARISRGDTYKNGFTYSRASIASHENIFFSYFAGGVIFHSHIGMLKWSLKQKS